MISAGYAAIEPATQNSGARVKAEPALHEHTMINAVAAGAAG